MCGIVTVISKKTYGFLKRDVTVFEELLFVDTLRGDDATGVIGVDKYGNFDIDKSCEDARDFLYQYHALDSYKTINKDGVALIGHNRKATIGKPSDETAHPFVVKDHFAMVHNGTLWNHKALHDTTVDSEALAMHLEATINGENYDIQKLADDLWAVNGAYACVWYNQKTHKVQCVRNKERPLWIADTDDAYYLASEGSMLHWILGRNGVKYKTLEAVPVDTLLTFSPGVLKEVVSEALPVKKSQPITPKTTGVMGSTAAGNNVSIGEGGAVSKNAFKRLNKALIGQEVNFWIDDYVEATWPHKPGDDTYIIMGSTDHLEDVRHIVKGKISLKEVHCQSTADLTSLFFKGKITTCTFNNGQKTIEVNLANITKVPTVYSTTKGTDEKAPITIH